MPLSRLPARDWQRIRPWDFAAIRCVSTNAGTIATILRPVSGGGNINAVFVQNADPELREANLKERNRCLWESWRAPLMTRAGFGRRWIFLCQTRNRGTKWIRRFPNSSNIRRYQQRNKYYAKG